MVLQISEDVKYLIRTKLKSNPTPGYSVAQNFDWENQILIHELLMHCKTALKRIRFYINLSDVSSVEKITLNIRNTLMTDLPPKVRVNPQLQQVTLKSLMSPLSKSKPAAYCKDIHIYIQWRPKAEVYDVDTFNTAFSTEACRLTESIENTAKYTKLRKVCNKLNRFQVVFVTGITNFL